MSGYLTGLAVRSLGPGADADGGPGAPGLLRPATATWYAPEAAYDTSAYDEAADWPEDGAMPQEHRGPQTLGAPPVPNSGALLESPPPHPTPDPAAGASPPEPDELSAGTDGTGPRSRAAAITTPHLPPVPSPSRPVRPGAVEQVVPEESPPDSADRAPSPLRQDRCSTPRETNGVGTRQQETDPPRGARSPGGDTGVTRNGSGPSGTAAPSIAPDPPTDAMLTEAMPAGGQGDLPAAAERSTGQRAHPEPQVPAAAATGSAGGGASVCLEERAAAISAESLTPPPETPTLLPVPGAPRPTSKPTPLASTADESPTVQVTIGRIEVRAAPPPAPASAPRRTPARRAGPSLAEYLRAREGGR